MKSSDATMSIGEIATRFGLATHVLRHWEATGLLNPARAGSRRRYGPEDLCRVAVILRAKEAGLSLGAIREMLTASAPEERQAILRRQREELTARIARTQAALDLIECALDCGHDDLARCPHFLAVVAERVSGTGSTRSI
ncbi:MerR family transcriptional regulator [Amycolatopsis thermoflava]|uniref:MerR family transcriptional regulator n=1 Tax=Amycolatopsis thermoflava TaxID=84480 RepID=UPI003811D13F